MLSNNRAVCNLNKVNYAQFFYRTKRGLTSPTLPKYPTANGTKLEGMFCKVSPDDAPETAEQAARRLGILDVWIPVCVLQFSSTHAIEYTGSKAKSIWKEYCRRIFKKEK